jgi:hypothetical protein
MPHPRAPKEFVGGTETPSIEAAILSTNWDRVKRAAPVVADVRMPFSGGPQCFAGAADVSAAGSVGGPIVICVPAPAVPRGETNHPRDR